MAIKKVQLRHPDRGKTAPRIDGEVYRAFRAALLKVIPRNRDGVSFTALPREVAARLPQDVRKRIGSVMWYVTTVKLDLEARGEIERVPKSNPQRVRRR